MSYEFFYSQFPEVAEQETRVITVLPESDSELLPGNYALCEMFCNERKCDCRRVLLYVTSSDDMSTVEAVVAYGWESRKFYIKWMGDNEEAVIDNLKGPALNVGSPQSENAYAVLDLVKDTALKDVAYVERLKRHYAMFRSKIEGRYFERPSRKQRKKRMKKK
jgi:hypothetical protein